jgi:hypothetical protein
MAGKDLNERVELPLDKAVEYMLEECRMVLPGIQTLFGFQLVVVFSERFARTVGSAGRVLHMAAIIFVAISIALIMTPAALHRRTEPYSVSKRFLSTCSRLILASMVPLALAIAIETWLVANALLQRPWVAVACATAVGLVFVVFWWGLPHARRTR